MRRIVDSVHVRQFIKFSIVGVGNTLIDFGFYIIATRLFEWHYLAANTFSWLCAVCFSFTMNKFWTFRAGGSGAAVRQYAKFVVVSVISLLISIGLLHLFVDSFHIHDIVAKLLTIGVVVFWNFFMNKFWTFST